MDPDSPTAPPHVSRRTARPGLPPPSAAEAPSRWLVRLPRVFAADAEEILGGLGLEAEIWHGEQAVQTHAKNPSAAFSPDHPLHAFIEWRLPLEHLWPVKPKECVGFIERPGQALARKFRDRPLQTIVCAALDPNLQDPWFRRLGPNLRGRLLQVLPPPADGWVDPLHQNPSAETLFCLVGPRALVAGASTPLAANGFFPDGARAVAREGGVTISRAGAKIAQALDALRLFRPPLVAGSRWIELGASPGGMTAELLRRDFHVTAIDRAPLDARLAGAAGLHFLKADVATAELPLGSPFDALLCDLNGDGVAALRHVIRFRRHLRPGALVVFTLKTPSLTSPTAILTRLGQVRDAAARAGFAPIHARHLPANRHELTLFLENSA